MRAAFAGAAVLLFFLAAEAVLSRALPESGEAENLFFVQNPLQNADLYLFDPVLFWRPRPGAADAGATVNADGFRGEIVPRRRSPGKARIALLGDSVLYGFHLSDADSIAGNLQKLWPGPESVEVLNAAVVGYSSFQARRAFRSRVGGYRPDFVIVYAGINDASDARFFEDKRQPILSESAGRIWEIAHRFGWYRAVRSAVRKVEGARPAPSPSVGSASRVSREDYAENLRMIGRDAKSIGANALFCRIAAISGDGRCIGPGYYEPPADLPLIDIPSAFSGICGADADKFFLDDVHPTPEGARVFAQAILKSIESRRAAVPAARP